jgi:hypothetical protein
MVMHDRKILQPTQKTTRLRRHMDTTIQGWDNLPPVVNSRAAIIKMLNGFRSFKRL